MTLKIENTPEILDKKSFEELFKTYFSQLVYFAKGYISDLDTSKEIVHDVFINLWNKRDTIDLNKQVKSYLFTSVHNRCLNYIRDNKKFNHNVMEFERINPDHNWDESDKVVESEIEAKIYMILETLPEKCKEIFMLSRFENLKYAEIAEKLDISVKTVETQMSKALKIFRENLKEYL
ncbi:MAG: RNA polymerase sigma-70 factor [Bacteroidia bacterium]|nr:RNA polymerase sigma-70 factor [Bacteroidia bacterium]